MSGKNKNILHVKLLDKIVPVEVRSQANSKKLKLYIRNGNIIINKPKYVTINNSLTILYDNAFKVYNMYIESENYKIENVFKQSMDILYFGVFYKLKVENTENIKSVIEIRDNSIILKVNKNLTYEQKVDNVYKMLEKLYKDKLHEFISQKLNYYTKLMNLNISTYTIKKMSSRYGSCNVKTHKLNFNLNLAFMKEDVISSIIVHELAHIVYSNHSQNFYNLVYKYCKNYDICQKWIKDNYKYLNLFK